MTTTMRTRRLVVEARRTVVGKPKKGPKPAKTPNTYGFDSVYPEWGTFPGGDGQSPIIPFSDEKNAEREIIHGRWAMLAVTGAYTGETYSGIPWFEAGSYCTPDDCSFEFAFLGGKAALAPEGSGYPSYWLVIALEILLVGSAEAYRTGITGNPFPELELSVSPGGRFDPLGLADSGDLEELKIKELKHCRLAMGAWQGCIWQAIATQEGPVKNLIDHRADAVHNNLINANYAPWL